MQFDYKKEEVEVFEGSFSYDRTEYGMQKSDGVGDLVNVKFYTELVKQ